MSKLADAAAWHETRVKLLRMSQQALEPRGVPNHRAEELAMHEQFAVAIREADGDEPRAASPVPDYRKLCIALLEGLEHVEGCAQCNADDWEYCDLGGTEAKKAMRDAQKVLG